MACHVNNEVSRKRLGDDRSAAVGTVRLDLAFGAAIAHALFLPRVDPGSRSRYPARKHRRRGRDKVVERYEIR